MKALFVMAASVIALQAQAGASNDETTGGSASAGRIGRIGSTGSTGSIGSIDGTGSIGRTSDRAVAPALPVEQVLSRHKTCSASLALRSQALTPAQEQAACDMLGALENEFHQVFQTRGKPVKDDGNVSLRANIYQSKEDFIQYATQHFNMPTNNGGMYLEGLPWQAGNQAEFVANQKKDGSIHNLGHEYVHYLDGRYNLYGDFCANLHDSHAPPENCAQPSPMAPYLVWWTEGVAEYLFKGANNPDALKLAPANTWRLSQLFDTAYESNNGTERIYGWGYLAARFMLEKHKPQVEQMLALTRAGDYPRYQALVRGWGTGMDAEFAAWLGTLAGAQTPATAVAPTTTPITAAMPAKAATASGVKSQP